MHLKDAKQAASAARTLLRHARELRGTKQIVELSAPGLSIVFEDAPNGRGVNDNAETPAPAADDAVAEEGEGPPADDNGSA